MNNEGIKIVAQKTLEKYEGLNNTSDVIHKIKEDLNVALNTYLAQNHVIREDFPIEFENELGKWKINSDGETYLQTKTTPQYIECNMTIKPNGEIEINDKD